jgi:hypothetical protein
VHMSIRSIAGFFFKVEYRCSLVDEKLDAAVEIV